MDGQCQGRPIRPSESTAGEDDSPRKDPHAPRIRVWVCWKCGSQHPSEHSSYQDERRTAGLFVCFFQSTCIQFPTPIPVPMLACGVCVWCSLVQDFLLTWTEQILPTPTHHTVGGTTATSTAVATTVNPNSLSRMRMPIPIPIACHCQSQKRMRMT